MIKAFDQEHQIDLVLSESKILANHFIDPKV